LRGVVTYYDTYFSLEGPFAFVSDESGSVFVQFTPTAAPVQPGDLVEVRGVSGPGGFAPIVDKASVRFVAKSHLPASAPRITAAHMRTGVDDARWVEAEGVVRAATTSNGYLVADMWTETGPLRVFIRDYQGLDGAHLVDAETTVRGNCAPDYNPKGQLVQLHLMTPSAEEVHVERPAPADPFLLPVRTIESLARFSPGERMLHRVKVKGTITSVRSKQFVLQDLSEGARVETTQPVSIRVGDEVEAVGFPAAGAYSPVLQDAVARRVGPGRKIEPVAVTPQQIIQGSYDATLVSIRGQLIENHMGTGDNGVLVLSSEGSVFGAAIDSKALSNPLSRMRNGSVLRLSGVCAVDLSESGYPESFRVLLRSPQDVAVLRGPSWWTVSRILALLAILAAIILVGALWLYVLRKRIEESTEALRATLESTADGILEVSAARKITAYNRKFAEMFGVPIAVLKSQDSDRTLELVAGQLQDPNAFLARVQQKCADQEAQTDDIIEGADERTFERHSEPQRVKGKSVGRVWGFRDVTERKRAEQALAASEALFRSYFEQPLIGTAITSAEKGFIAVNDRTCAILGYSRDELMQMDWATLTHPDDLATGVSQFNRVLSGEIDDYSLDKRYIRKDGRIIWGSIAARCVRKPDGTLDYICTVLQDITERKQTEGALRDSEMRYRTIFESAGDAILLSKGDVFTDCSAKALELFRCTRDQLVGHTLLDFSPRLQPDGRNCKQFAREMVQQVLAGEETRFEWQFCRPDGTHFDAKIEARRQIIAGESYLLGIISDITSRKQAEAENSRLAAAIEQSAEGIVITDLQGNIEYINPAFTRITGYSREEALGQNPRILKSGKHDAAFYRQLWSTILKGATWHGEIINRRKDGTLYTEQMSVAPVKDEGAEVTHFIATKLDISERKRLEQQFIQAQKMEAVGRLAAGVAHDFNNLLTIINGHCGLMVKQLPPDNPARESFTEIREAGERAAGLTRQLLAFSRQEIRTSRVLDLNTLVDNSIKMLRRLIGEDIDLVFSPARDLNLVCADPGQVEQVLMNLAVNSRDAMPKGGKLSIEICNFQVGESYAKSHYPMPPGAYVMLAISDTGQGMDAETQARIFEPFFTTKGLGKGTGLGLATVYGIVKQNGGYTWVYSELGKGTTFKIYLPAVEGTAESTKEEVAKGGGSETLLLVEDEVKVRNLARRMLESEGYKVLEAAGGMEALLVASQHKGPIHMLLTDVVMPVMSGRELAQRLAKLHPQMKILYMSGYTDDTIVRHGVLESGVTFLQKPFAAEVLARKVRVVLDK
jgi:PAS domain S-box-containing protein